MEGEDTGLRAIVDTVKKECYGHDVQKENEACGMFYGGGVNRDWLRLDKTGWRTGHFSSRITGSDSVPCSNARNLPFHTLIPLSFEIQSGGNRSS